MILSCGCRAFSFFGFYPAERALLDLTAVDVEKFAERQSHLLQTETDEVLPCERDSGFSR